MRKPNDDDEKEEKNDGLDSYDEDADAQEESDLIQNNDPAANDLPSER